VCVCLFNQLWGCRLLFSDLKLCTFVISFRFNFPWIFPYQKKHVPTRWNLEKMASKIFQNVPEMSTNEKRKGHWGKRPLTTEGFPFPKCPSFFSFSPLGNSVSSAHRRFPLVDTDPGIPVSNKHLKHNTYWEGPNYIIIQPTSSSFSEIY
jgi:hypothetical protein